MSLINFNQRLDPLSSPSPYVLLGSALNRVIVDEFYLSDVSLSEGRNAADTNDIVFRTASAGPIRITSYSTPAVTSVSRTMRHIRNDQCDFHVFWFVSRGEFSITQSGRSVTIRDGEFAITTSSKPASFRTRLDKTGHFESFQVQVPTHMLVEMQPCASDLCGQRFETTGAMAKMSYNVLVALFSEAEGVPPSITSQIAIKAIEALVQVASGAGGVKRLNIKEERKQKILDYIEFHLGEPSLTASRIAEANGISPRYLHYLLADDNTTLRDQIWERRLHRARELIIDERYAQLGITEIAYLVGFKSPAHFSRSYRKRFGFAPRDTRKTSGAERSPASADATGGVDRTGRELLN